jgi:hypothetical protein
MRNKRNKRSETKEMKETKETKERKKERWGGREEIPVTTPVRQLEVLTSHH